MEKANFYKIDFIISFWKCDPCLDLLDRCSVGWEMVKRLEIRENLDIHTQYCKSN